MSVILKLDPATGAVLQPSGQPVGTYVIAKLSSGNTDSLVIDDLYFNTDNNLIAVARSWFLPLNPDRSPMTHVSGSSPFAYTVELRPDLTGAIAVSAPGLSSNDPDVPNTTPCGGTPPPVSGSVESLLGMMLLSLGLGLVALRCRPLTRQPVHS